MPGGLAAAQLDEQPLVVEHDAREDENQPILPDDEDTPVTEKERTPLPWKPLIILTALNAVCPLAFELVYPFINSMIVEIGVTDDPERVGFYSGLIVVIPFGYVSDHVGRKPVVLLGKRLGGLSVSIVSFGMSKSLTGMIMSRCIGGALGASWAAIKVMVGETTDRSNQDTAFSMMNMSYRFGQIIGLPLGGLLAHPERRWKAFQTPFWKEYPFILPCFVGAGFSLISVLFGFFFIQEALKKARRKAKRSPYSSGPSTPKPSTPLLVNEENQPSKKPTWRTVMTPSILSLVVNNACMCIASEMLFSVYPLFAFTPIASGGLGMSEGEIGAQMSVRAVVHILIMLVYSKVNRALGTLRLYQVTMVFWSLVVLGFPFLHRVASQTGIKSVVFNAAQFVFFLTWSVCGFAWVCMGSMVNDASPSAEALSLINGISQMSIVLPQAISPALANSLFAASVEKHILGGNLVWVLLFVFSEFQPRCLERLLIRVQPALRFCIHSR
ncbi:MFS general substrate transporter, putative [Rhizoctonia solani AG-3 Rhs1AP]|uniref:MFS general substrate transporter, putative n=2 Tax=Rhizoctonia solani AG-3 TaxID=1086053 RepID=X8JSM9_9AGAM|nr:MFS general substrate transporter, putative [Rhizoctonia solani AG-3 Rhs1AP]KEP50483.1 putative MFS general substrate transporter [Rhizoctonia solani 123E]